MHGFKEEVVRGDATYPFEKYNIKSHIASRFASNHWHDETEIIFIENGNVHISINGKKFFGETGDIFVVNSGEMHEISGVESPIKYTAFVFDIEMLTPKIAEKQFDVISSGEMLIKNYIGKNDTLFDALINVDKLNDEKPNCYKLMTVALLLQFFSIVMGRNMYLPNGTRMRKRKNTLLKKIILYVEENFDREISLTETANKFNMSHKYFCKFFKNNFNKTFVEYLNTVRVDKATAMLEEGMSVTETALSCGFNNMSYFTLIFKRKMGYTPSQYRKIISRREVLL